MEFLNQSVQLEPVLAAISDFIDSHGELIEAVRRDLDRGLKNPATGRSGLSALQVLRSLVLQRVKNWDYRELRERIADGFTLRRFADFYSRRVPKHEDNDAPASGVERRGVRRASGRTEVQALQKFTSRL